MENIKSEYIRSIYENWNPISRKLSIYKADENEKAAQKAYLKLIFSLSFNIKG